jgi:hypothetical protein
VSAPTKRTVRAWSAQANATVALLTRHLGPVQVIAVLPREALSQRASALYDAPTIAKERRHAGGAPA